MDVIFVDTTIQVDRIIQESDKGKLRAIAELLGEYEFKAGCTYSLVELKRVVLQNLSYCLSLLNEQSSFFLAMRELTRLGPQRARRVSTLLSIMAWVGWHADAELELDVNGTIDEQLYMQSVSFIRTNIFFLWARFSNSVDTMLDRTQCARAKEGPKMDSKGDVKVQIRESLCDNAECNNANFLRSQLPVINQVCQAIDLLEASGRGVTSELITARDELKLARHDPARLYNYRNCLKIGDVWLHLESLVGGVKHFATTNYKESVHLCPPMGLEMKNPYKAV